MSKLKKGPYVILDSNIIQYTGNQDLRPEVIKVLEEAMIAGYTLAISDYTFFELLKGSSTKVEREVISVLSGIPRIFVKKSVLIAAAHLGCLLYEDGLELKNIDDGDLIVGASAILTGSLVYTANIRDFPAPFFREVARRSLEYKKKGIPAQLFTAFLEPDLQLIGQRHGARAPA